MQNTLITVKHRGQLMTEDFMTKVLELYPTCFGVAVLGDHLGKFVSVTKDLEPCTIDELNQMQESFKDHGVVLGFCRMDHKPVSLDHVPPFTLLTDDVGRPTLVAFIDGDFENTEHPNSTAPAVYHTVEDYLRPWFTDQYALAEKDTKKLCDRLTQPLSRKTLLNSGIKGVHLTLFANTGEIISITAEDMVNYPWGQISKSIGELPAAVASAGRSLADKMKAASKSVGGAVHTPDVKVTPPAEAPKPVEAPKPNQDKPVLKMDDVKKKDVEAHHLASTTDIKSRLERPEFMVDVPESIRKDTTSQKKKWFHVHCHSLPAGWKEGHAFSSKFLKSNSPLARLKSLSELKGVVDLSEDKKAPAKEAPMETPKENPQEHATPKITQVPGTSIPTEQLKEVVDVFLKAVDNNSTDLQDIEHIQEIEKQSPRSWELIGIERNQVNSWSATDLELLQMEFPQFAHKLMLDLRMSDVKKDYEIASLRAVLSKYETAASPIKADEGTPAEETAMQKFQRLKAEKAQRKAM